jgi:serine/threonine protein kinase
MYILVLRKNPQPTPTTPTGLPFDGETKLEIIERTLTAQPSFANACWAECEPSSIDFIKNLLQKKPEDRLTVSEAHTHTLTHRYTRAHTHTYIHTRARVHTRTHTRTHTHTHTHTYTHTHTHTGARASLV